MRLDLNKTEDKYLFIIAGILFFVWIVDAAVKLWAKTTVGWLWFCSISSLIVAIIIFYKKSDLLLVFLSVSIIAQGIWIFDILSISFFGITIFGIWDYLLAPIFSKAEIITTMRHFFLIPLELFAFIFMKKLPRRFLDIISYTFFISLGFLGVSLIFGGRYNLNFVYFPPFDLGFTLPNPFFFFAYLSFIVVSGTIISYLFFFFFKKYEKLFNIKHIRIYFWIALFFIILISIKVTLFVFKEKGNGILKF